MAEGYDPRWIAATDQIFHRLADGVAPPAATPAPPATPAATVGAAEAVPGTLVLNADSLFDAVVAEVDADKAAEERVGRPKPGALPRDHEQQGTGCREYPARQPEMAGW